MKKRLTVLIVSGVLMFAWIFLAVALTGGREAADFTQRDKQIMLVFAVTELLTVVVMFVSACAVGKQVGRSMPKMESVSLTKAEIARKRTGALLLWGSLVLSIAAQIGGIFLWKWNDAWVTDQAKWLCGLGYLLGLVVLPLVSVLAAALQKRRFDKMSVAQANAFLLSHREQAEQTAERKLGQLRLIRLASNGYALVLFLLGLSLSLLSGYLYRSDSISVARDFGAAFLMAAAAQQILLPVPKAFLEEIDGFLPEEDYPRLYELARRAGLESGWQGPVRLYVMPLSGAGVGKVRGVICLRLGALTLGMMTEEELYAIFLHEFAHEGGENRRINREEDYYTFLSQGRSPNVLSALTSFYYSYLDGVYSLTHELYHYAASIGIETRADRMMARNPQAAAASLLKLKYYDLYLWEGEVRDNNSDFQSGTPPKHLLARELEGFLKALPWRREDWNAITKKELPSRSATHPTAWERIQSLGLTELPAADELPSGEFARECAGAIAFLDGRVEAAMEAHYGDSRRERYVEPLERVTAWEASGCPLSAQDYADVAADLQALGRMGDAAALCERAISELPPAAACHAHFLRGIHRLHCYDSSGLEDLYTAISGNSNYIDEAMDQIGSYCCLMGLEKELEEYRKTVLELGQRQKDEFSELDKLTRRDQLSQEHLPEGMLEGILAFVKENDQNSIDKLYLVRKNISDGFFTSAVVICFSPETTVQVREAVRHKLFRYLDTSTDWQFSLFELEEIPKGLVERVEGSCVYQK